jgi:DNA mismatch repair protein MutS2
LALYPSTQRPWIQQRLAETSQLKALLDQGDRIPLAGLCDLTTLFANFGKKQSLFEPEELIEICDTLAASGRLKHFFYELTLELYPHLHALGDHLHEFTDLVQEINRCIDGREGVRDEASSKLGEIRSRISSLNAALRKKFHHLVSNPQVRKAIENDNFMMRHGRPVVAIKAHYRMHLKGTVLDRSHTGATLYVEPDELIELSNDLESARFEERKEVDRILWELTHQVLSDQDDILATLKTLGLIDLAYAKARFSQDFAMSAPDINTYVQLRDARHPLLMQWTAKQRHGSVVEWMKDVVPISPRLGRDFDLLLITGPNTGGKTVLLKTVGLCVLMAQSGMHIPAGPGSQVAIYHQVFADIGDEQSIQQSLSTFSAHIKQIIHVLKHADKRTLVLLDELGAGTDPTEGAALATAILDALISQEAHTVATTHLGDLKTFAYSEARAENASVQFDVDSLEPTYKLFIGTPGSSNALIIADKLGMNRSVTSQAQALLAKNQDGSSDLINQVQKTRELAERKRRKAQTLLDKAKHMRVQAAERLSEINEQEKRLEHQANHEIDQTLQQVRDLMAQFERTMGNAPKTWHEKAQTLKEKLHALTASTPLAQRHQAFVDTLKKGDSVYAIPFKRVGLIDRIRRKREIVILLVDGKHIELGFHQIARPTHLG